MEEDRESLLANAGHHIVTDNIPEALQLISRAELVRSGEDIQRLRAVASLLNLDYRTAIQSHRVATTAEMRGR